MTEFASARVVIIGGGAVGASCLFHLAKAGWTDCLLLEKNELTAGSTWHAAGNVPTFSASWSIMNIQRYSAGLYRGLGAEVDYPMNYHVTGSVRLGHSAERLQEFKRVVGMGRTQGMELAILGPDEIRAKYPFVETHDLTGALYDPYDGDIDPAQLTQALAKGARNLGARIERFCPVTDARWTGTEWILTTPKGEVRAEYVVNAAGYYAREVAKMFNRDLPMMVMSHQYMLFDTIPEIEAYSAETGGKLPLLRDVDSSYYLRQEKHGFNLGPYERNCRAHWTTPDDPFPQDFSFQLFPDDLDRLEWYIADAMARVPLLEKAALTKVINGPIPYTPDGNPLIGPMPGVPNAFEACVFTFGICQAGGAGKVLAEWVTEGGTEWDMWSCDPRRFTGWEDEDYCIQKGMEVYGHEYGMHFPMARWPAAPDRKLSPVHDRVKALGGVMAPYNGWERAEWFAMPGDDTSWEATQTWNRAGPWEARIAAECAAVRDGAGVLDLPGFTRLRLSGPGARAHLDSLTASRLPPDGKIGLAYFADARGRIVTEMTVLPFNDEDIGVITAAIAQKHDADLIRRGLPEGVTLEDWSDRIHCFIVTGPKARDILAPITEADLSLPWLSIQYFAKVAGRDVALVRVSFAGELGWEIHCDRADAQTIYDAVLQSGAVPFGMRALNALRIEKGYRAWKGDLSTDYSLLEGGLERFIDWTKEFPGKAALAAEKQRGVTKRFVALKVATGPADPPYMANLWHQGRIVGEVTSAAMGHRVGHVVALGMLKTDLAVPGTALEVEVYGERLAAEVLGFGAAWDAKNERIKA
ncbi:MAG: FAD-dependent oxidoreductase [Tabrizicola sp.]|uniref:GcvT family protein n=1 Tax=Tabrizicola sp. TaxID=2005166 RepID=UPI0027374A3B|nr:FAD-dependent oxidoreductase [Tabrizicola sp.]MDP3264514.1 FAD-dependent oxidoreductase [Tabrizicola sp.]MDP3649506.1 FAD-dependent oxidoreductase [Paracoccaceae bacterium]MDZ4069252.1 FAD-dependent oxidoreductase [Tabrizicola sp.]